MDKGSKNYELIHQFVDRQNLIFWLFDLKQQNVTSVLGNPKEIIGIDPLADGYDLQSFASLFYHPDDQHLVKIKTEFFEQKNGGTWAGIFRVKNTNGQWIWIYYRHFAMGSDAEGLPTHIGGFFFDFANHLQTPVQLKELMNEMKKHENHEKIRSLTKRETEIIRLITKGNDHTAIAAKLNISPNTVDTHRKNILRKLDLHNIGSLSCFATEMGLV